MTQIDDKEGVRKEGAFVKKRGKRNFFFKTEMKGQGTLEMFFFI